MSPTPFREIIGRVFGIPADADEARFAIAVYDLGVADGRAAAAREAEEEQKHAIRNLQAMCDRYGLEVVRKGGAR